MSEIELKFDLHEDHADVDSRLKMKNSAGTSILVLDGEKLELRYVKVAGKTLSAADYEVSDTQLTVTLSGGTALGVDVAQNFVEAASRDAAESVGQGRLASRQSSRSPRIALAVIAMIGVRLPPSPSRLRISRVAS